MIRVLCFVFASIVCILVSGCDTSSGPDPLDPQMSSVFILNEGAFQAGNAELSVYDPAAGTVRGNAYSSANPGLTLGDVANSMTIHDGRLYIAVNNSGRIEVIDASTHTSLGRIALPGLPRYVSVLGPAKAYVTMQDSTVAVVDPGTFSYVRSITVGAFPEAIVQSAGKLFVMNGGFGWGASISVIDPGSDSVVSTIPTPFGPSYAAVGPGGMVYVVCTGGTDFSDPSNDTPGAVLALDPIALRIVDSLSIPGHPGKFTIDSNGMLFLIGPGTFPATPVWSLTVTPSLAVMNAALVQGSFYGIGLLEERREILLADAGSFTTNGKVHVYSYDGVPKSVLSSGIGIAPNSFLLAGE